MGHLGRSGARGSRILIGVAFLVMASILISALRAEEEGGASPPPPLPIAESPAEPTGDEPLPASSPVPPVGESPAGALAGKETKQYEELTTRDGTTYRECRVIRSEPSGLLIEHTRGVARLSFFDLPEAVQTEWGFDPFKGMEHFKAEAERERSLRWQLFWERQQYESEQDRLAMEDRLRATAEREWVPIEARVIRKIPGEAAFVARCQRVTFQKTKTKSTLGFEIDGPPKRVLVPFGEKPVILRLAIPSDPVPGNGVVWKGYADPVSQGEGNYQFRGRQSSASSFDAVPVD